MKNKLRNYIQIPGSKWDHTKNGGKIMIKCPACKQEFPSHESSYHHWNLIHFQKRDERSFEEIEESKARAKEDAADDAYDSWVDAQ